MFLGFTHTSVKCFNMDKMYGFSVSSPPLTSPFGAWSLLCRRSVGDVEVVNKQHVEVGMKEHSYILPLHRALFNKMCNIGRSTCVYLPLCGALLKSAYCTNAFGQERLFHATIASCLPQQCGKQELLGRRIFTYLPLHRAFRNSVYYI